MEMTMVNAVEVDAMGRKIQEQRNAAFNDAAILSGTVARQEKEIENLKSLLADLNKQLEEKQSTDSQPQE